MSGLARLIAEYSKWDDPYETELAKIERYVVSNGYNDRSSKRHLVDVRRYLFAYMTAQLDMGPVAIGEMFDLGSSNISIALKPIDFIVKDVDFLSNTTDVREHFPINMEVMCERVLEKRERRNYSKTKKKKISHDKKVYGGYVPVHIKEKYDMFRVNNGCTTAEKTLIELIRKVEL